MNNIKSAAIHLLGRPFYGVYVTLYLVSCIVIYNTVEGNLRDLINDQVGRWFAFGIVGVSFVHVFLIYLSIHNIEEYPDRWKKAYDGWIGNRIEISMRWVIVLLLMVFAGKGLSVDNPALIGFFLMLALVSWDVLSAIFSKNIDLWDIVKFTTLEGRFFWSDFLGALVWVAVYSSRSDIIAALNYLAFTAYLLMISYRAFLYTTTGHWLLSNSTEGE